MKRLLSVMITLGIILSISTVPVFAERDYTILKMLNIMVGDENGDMRLSDNVTRAEFTKVATSVSKFRKSIPLTQKTSPFADVQYNHWASPYIRAGIDNGIVQGYPDSTFRPDNNVIYEEALTILLKILGYTDSDFGAAYPYGQYALADNIGLTEGINANLGEALTRKQVADLLMNTLDTEFKDQSMTPYGNFDITKIEDVVLLATAKEDGGVPFGKIKTSAGIYKFDEDLSKDINKKGTVFLKDGDTIISFEPENDTNITEYTVYSVLADSIVTYKDGNFSNVTFSDNIVTYSDAKETVFSLAKPELKMGDIISVVENSFGETEYLSISEGECEGPFVYTSSNALIQKTGDINNYLLIKKGDVVTINDLNKNDIYYFYKDMKILMAYDTKITGIYTSASPNQETPETIEVSGKTYEIESPEAFKLLSSTGSFKYGDVVTLLLGKDNKIAGVVEYNKSEGKNVGYLIDVGIKLYETNNDKEVSDYYVSVLNPDGNTETYRAKQDYSNYKNSVVEIEFESGKAELTRLKSNNMNSTAVFNAESLTFGNYTVSKDVEILDVNTTNADDNPLYVTIKPQRIDGVTLYSDSVLYCEVNEKNAVTKLILEEVSGDYYSYGYVTKAEKNTEMMRGTYEYTFDGITNTHITQGMLYGVNAGPAKITIGATGVELMQNITQISGTVSKINNTSITVGNINYLLAEDVKIFYKNSDWDCMLLSLEDISGEETEYKISGVYHDKSSKYGGRVRVIMVTKKPSK